MDPRLYPAMMADRRSDAHSIVIVGTATNSSITEETKIGAPSLSRDAQLTTERTVGSTFALLKTRANNQTIFMVPRVRRQTRAGAES